MPNYAVLLEVRNIRMEMEGSGSARHGFYTTFFVSATDPDSAISEVRCLVGEDEKISLLLKNGPGFDLPEFSMEIINELESFEGKRLPRTGLVFYEMED
jgi:hypothetical protein